MFLWYQWIKLKLKSRKIYAGPLICVIMNLAYLNVSIPNEPIFNVVGCQFYNDASSMMTPHRAVNRVEFECLCHTCKVFILYSTFDAVS